MAWKYRPIRVMLEPTGFWFRVGAFFRWAYFRNPHYPTWRGPATFIRIFGWERKSLRQEGNNNG